MACGARFLIVLLLLATLAGAQVSERNVRGHMEFLASDALQGRGSGTEHELIAATYIASQLRQYGVQPAGDDGTYIQTLPVGDPKEAAPPGVPARLNGKRKLQGPQFTWNVIGVVPGTAGAEGDAILLSAHLDHVGVRGDDPRKDNIYNGADDDASGVTAVLELARALGNGDKPKRTVYFVFFGSEEKGGYGARRFIASAAVPLEKIAANLEFEMIGRSDPKVAAKTLWLTGYDRSNLGPGLAKQGARLVADPHPEQNFFTRSDNYLLAKRGVVAHTVSSYGLHPEYHQPNDDLAHIDFAHMTEAINSMVAPVRWLANSDFKPQWLPGKKP